MIRLLVCGDRNWSDRSAIRSALTSFRQIEVVIHGAAKGADSLAGEEAEDLGIPVQAFPADWKTYGRAAGPIRNQQMLREGKPGCVLAFHEDLSRSKGTADMVARARKAGIPVAVFNGKEWHGDCANTEE